MPSQYPYMYMLIFDFWDKNPHAGLLAAQRYMRAIDREPSAIYSRLLHANRLESLEAAREAFDEACQVQFAGVQKLLEAFDGDAKAAERAIQLVDKLRATKPEYHVTAKTVRAMGA